MVTFTVGELFNSFADLQQKLFDYSESHFCHFYIKDSKKLTPDEIVNASIIYKHIVYSCIYGGQKPRFRGSGSRSVTSIRHGCSASLYLRVTKDRAHLQVRSFSDAHNHDITEELYRSAAQDKKLPWDLKIELEELLLLGADKDRLIDYVRYVSRKNLDKKNLFNIYDAAVKQQREISRDRAIMLVQKAYAIDTEEEAEAVLQGLLHQSRPQRKNRKQEIETMEDVQVTYYNEGDESQGEILETATADESLQQMMATLSGQDGERIVIVQQDEDPLEVIEAENDMEEYLEEDGKEIVIKREPGKDSERGSESPRYITLSEFSRLNRKKPVKRLNKAKKINATQYIQHNLEDTIVYEEPANKTRIVSFNEGDEMVIEGSLNDARLQKIHAEHEKLLAETEVLKLQRNQVLKDTAKLDVEKNKLFLEIDLIKQKKKYMEAKNEKLKLEIAKLKYELNEN